jgi:hypothetical protein|tara:strand:- start:249 stop:458 length:210 start_codon:yes stop_codon:yes gene_type:complete
MKEYTFTRQGGDTKVIEAMSLKKAIKKYDGKPNDHDDHAVITWTSKKNNDSDKTIKLPHVSRKERKGKL